MAYPARSEKRPKPPLNRSTLRSLGLFYVGKYATTRRKLTVYLARKVNERGWTDENAPDIAALIESFANLGYVDDTAFAEARAASLVRRGFGRNRIRSALQHAGIDSQAAQDISHMDEDEALESALRFAKRKHIWPFGSAPDDPKQRNRAVAAMLRAGHSFDVTQTVLNMPREIDATA